LKSSAFNVKVETFEFISKPKKNVGLRILKRIGEIFFKTVILSILLSIPIFFQSGCQSSSNQDKTVVDVIKHFESKGIKIETMRALPGTVLKAESAVALKISGREVGLYKYNIKPKKVQEKLEKIKKTGCIYALGIKLPAIVNGSFLLMDYEKNPSKDKIISAFESF
jgi:hypothetical protein